MVLKVQSKNGKVYEGEGFCIDPVTKSLLLKTTDGDYVIVNPDNVSSISGPFSSIIVPDLGEHQLRYLIFMLCFSNCSFIFCGCHLQHI